MARPIDYLRRGGIGKSTRLKLSETVVGVNEGASAQFRVCCRVVCATVSQKQ
jgi:hypothetical protein